MVSRTKFLDAQPLAHRLERLSAAAVARIIESASSLAPDSMAEWQEVSGAVVAYMEPDSSMNHVVGLGMGTPVEAADVERIERFYSDRHERPLAAVCELVDPELLALLKNRRWRFDGFENVLVRHLVAGDDFSGGQAIEIREATSAADREAWALAAAAGFSAPDDPRPEQLAVSRAAAACSQSRLFSAFELGEIAGVGELSIADGVAWLSADTTLPQFRRRGIQGALQRARLKCGLDSGCDLAVTEAAPGSGSQRNMRRLGFEVAYRRLDFVGP